MADEKPLGRDSALHLRSSRRIVREYQAPIVKIPSKPRVVLPTKDEWEEIAAAMGVSPDDKPSEEP